MKTPRLFLVFALAVVASAGVDLSKSIPSLALKDGRTLENVTLVSYGSKAVMAKWDGGRGTLAYELFPEDYAPALASNRPVPSPTPSANVPATVRKPADAFPPLDTSPIAPLPAEAVGAAQSLSGQCFVVTKGGQNFKLGLVEVCIYPKEHFDQYLAEIELRTKARFDAMRLVALPKDFRSLSLDQMKRSTSVSKQWMAEVHARWSLLPPPTTTAKTDADGRFALTHSVAPPFVVFARAMRTVGDNTEHYVWSVGSDKIPNPAQLFLSNDNMR